MTNPSDDFTSRGWLVATATLLMLLIISFIPPFEVGAISLRRASIFSDVISLDDKAAPSLSEQELKPEINIEDFEVDLEQVAEQVAQTTATASPTAEQTSASWEGIFDEQPTGESPSAIEEPQPEAMPTIDSILLNVDYSAILPADSMIIELLDYANPDQENINPDQESALHNFYEKILSGKNPVRIGFMGDSFVEGDILTADLRELLQDSFGGGGVGFVPVASPFTGFRQTVKTQSKGWKPYNIMQSKTTPEPYASDFFVSGWVASCEDGASTRWDMSDKRRHLTECSRARLLFISRQASELSITLNEGEERSFSFEAGEAVRQIVVEEKQISSLEVKIKSGAAGFTAIGAEFDAIGGVSVDNLSVRSNNGQAMFRSNAAVNAQINTMRPYDMIVLQYGLNIMQADREDYSLYASQVEKMIRYVRSCFPDAAVVVMGVSDRSQKNEQGIVPMTSARSLSEWQRGAAEASGCSFWDTYEAMQRLGGMSAFVANGWAGKDYTHINYAGGREIARMFYYSILQGVQEYCAELRERLERQKPIIEEPIISIEAKPLELPHPTTDSINTPQL